MAGMHRTRRRRRMGVALVSAATATAAALTVGVEPPPPSAKRVVVENVDLAATIRLLPDHDQVPDITGGLGTAGYDGAQALADVIIKAVANGIDLSAFARAAGLDPQSLLNGLLADLPANLLPGILASLALDVPLLGPVLAQLTGGDVELLTNLLKALGIGEVTGATLTGILALLGLNLADPLNLGGLDVPGLNVVTAGPTFTALKLFGLDLGWTPSLPNSVANEINRTEYARLGVDGVLYMLLSDLQQIPAAGPLIGPLTALIGSLADAIPDVIDVRVTPTVGIGLGAFAAAMAYQKALADLSMQPGGLNHVFGADPILGSLTVLPLILVDNPARPDGGAFARFGPLAALFGINTVNPTTKATSSGDGTGVGIPVIGTGVTLGNANILPILVDATYEYQPLSDLASWPNPVTLANNLTAALLPTYMLRGLNLNLDGLTDQVLESVTNAVRGINPTDPSSALALNIYLTLHSATLPLLEPLYLTSDVLNLVGLSPLAQIPMRLANALAPALRILNDAGYANVTRNADGTYTRDFAQAGVETPFLSLPNLNPGLVISDTINALVTGFQKELGPNPTPNTPNVLANLLDALLSGDLLSGLGGTAASAAPVSAAPLSVAPVSALSKTAAGDVPAPNAPLLGIASVEASTSSGGAEVKAVAARQESKPTAEAVDQASAAEVDVTPAKGPKHAKPETGTDTDTAADDGADAETAKPPKPAKPTTNETRDTANDFSPKPADEPDTAGAKGGDAGTAATGNSDPGTGAASDEAA